MSATKDTKRQGKLKRQTGNEVSRLEEMAKDNLQTMNHVVKILPEEPTKHPNYKKYFLKYGAYTLRWIKQSADTFATFLLTDFQQA